MTIIAFKDGTMAADSESDGGNLRYPSMRPKIARGPGGLAGATGMTSDCVAFCRWFADGEKPEARPEYTGKGDDEMQAITARPDGTLWRTGHNEIPFEIAQPYAIGGGYAWSFCEGAMRAGLSAADAVALTIKHVRTVGGSVQVEHLRQPLAAVAQRFGGTSWLLA